MARQASTILAERNYCYIEEGVLRLIRWQPGPSLALLAIASIVLGCGGGDQGRSSADNSKLLPIDTDLSTVVIQAPDVPPGFLLFSESQTPNGQAAGFYFDSDKWYDNFERWQRIDGYSIRYWKDLNVIDSIVSLFVDEKGAKSAFEEGAVEIRDLTQHQLELRGAVVDVAEELNGPSLADDTFRFAISGTAEDSEASLEFKTVIVDVREGNVIASIRWISEGSNLPLPDIEALVKKQLERIQSAKIGAREVNQ